MVTIWQLSSYGRHIEIQDGRHIIRHAVFKERQMSLTLSVVTEKVFISPFRSGSDGSHIQFHDDGCIAGHFQCRWAYQYTSPRIIVHVAFLPIASPTTLAKWGAFQVCLKTIANPIAILSTFAWYQFNASYFSDRQCGPCRYITGSLGCLPSPISNVWKFRLYF